VSVGARFVRQAHITNERSLKCPTSCTAFTIDAPVERVHDLIATNWGAYLASLKTGAERGAFAAFPAGEMSRWG
jgi:hypothetical protein